MKKISYLVLLSFLSVSILLSFQNCAKIEYQAKNSESADNVAGAGAGAGDGNGDGVGPIDPNPGTPVITCENQKRNLKIEGPNVLEILQLGQFTLKGTENCKNIKSYIWNGGDGSADVVKTEPKYEHKYQSAGVYRLRTDVVEDNNDSHRVFHQVSVPAKCEPGKACNFTLKDVFVSGPEVGQVGKSYEFVLHSPNGFAIKSAQWDFRDGSAVEFGNPKQAHIFTAVGVYQILIQVEDTAGNKRQLNHQITIYDSKDHPDCPIEGGGISSPTIARVGVSVPFVLALPKCFTGRCDKFLWEYGNGIKEYAGTSVRHKFAKEGVYTVKVSLYKKEDPKQVLMTFMRTIRIVGSTSGHICHK
jgi:PKD repeat protein